ncbi:hypothetical protein [Xanthobacter sediminis]|uniref:hypothetical protein n=1 Tax=Xanthobacter sediminis TaxID=3119926 RepID=UPI003727E0A9
MGAMRIFRASGRVAAVLALGLGPALADPLPAPAGDFSLKARLPHGALAEMAYSQRRMRTEVSKPDVAGTMVALIELDTRRMVMLSPQMPKVALEMPMLPEYVVGIVTGTGTRTGRSEVAGAPCDQWRIDPPAELKGKAVSLEACITPDGISLRAEVEIQGSRKMLYEATELVRGPQDPKLFALPPGVKVVKMPKDKLGLIPGGALKF